MLVDSVNLIVKGVRNRDGLKIRIITYARCGQVFDLYNIAAAVFRGQDAAHERGYNSLIRLMVHRRYRT